jgi:quercetin dioxygenase-like cupin family protein
VAESARQDDNATEGRSVEKLSLTALAHGQLETARGTSNGRASKTVYGGQEHALRQTVIALMGGQELHEHENPGEATVHVLQGSVELRAENVVWNGSAGDLLVVPDCRHSLAALEDSVVLLTVSKQL